MQIDNLLEMSKPVFWEKLELSEDLTIARYSATRGERQVC